jgi:hypothetical protein
VVLKLLKNFAFANNFERHALFRLAHLQHPIASASLTALPKSRSGESHRVITREAGKAGEEISDDDRVHESGLEVLHGFLPIR